MTFVKWPLNRSTLAQFELISRWGKSTRPASRGSFRRSGPSTRPSDHSGRACGPLAVSAANSCENVLVWQKVKSAVRSIIPKRWVRSRRRSVRFDSVVLVDSMANATSMLKEHRLVLVGQPQKAKWLKFSCPCGCGEVLALNLMESHSPRWSLHREFGNRITVWPSVRSTKCGAHFFLRSNNVEWC